MYINFRLSTAMANLIIYLIETVTKCIVFISIKKTLPLILFLTCNTKTIEMLIFHMTGDHYRILSKTETTSTFFSEEGGGKRKRGKRKKKCEMAPPCCAAPYPT